VEIEQAKAARVKSLEQKALKLSEEVEDHWEVILDETGLYHFDKRARKIAATLKVTPD
jgi:hypothetical protein